MRDLGAKRGVNALTVEEPANMSLEAIGEPPSPAPSELAGPVPRKVRFKFDGDGRFLLITVLLLFIGGSIFLGWTCFDDFEQFQQRAALRDNAREATGEVTGFVHHRFAPLGIVYKFSADGTAYSNEVLEPNTPVPGAALNKGDSLPILFLTSNPRINHPAAWEWSVLDGWYTVAGVCAGIVIGDVVLVGLLRDRKLARYGKVALGVVRRCTRDRRLFRIEYQFQPEDGIVASGCKSGLDEYPEGTRIWILYLPANPRRNSRYPLDFFDVVD